MQDGNFICFAQLSSNINEVIRAILNFFIQEFHKHKKHKNPNKRISDYFSLRDFLGAFFIFVRL